MKAVYFIQGALCLAFLALVAFSQKDIAFIVLLITAVFSKITKLFKPSKRF